MIRLPTQFDAVGARAASVTPSGACCSCCCCCVATAIGATGYTAFSLGGFAKASPAESRMSSGSAIAAGVFVAPAAIVAGAIAGAAIDSLMPVAASLVLPLVAWIAALAYLYRITGTANGILRAVTVVVATIVVFVVEFMVALAMLGELNVYLALAVAVGLAAAVVEYRVLYASP